MQVQSLSAVNSLYINNLQNTVNNQTHPLQNYPAITKESPAQTENQNDKEAKKINKKTAAIIGGIAALALAGIGAIVMVKRPDKATATAEAAGNAASNIANKAAEALKEYEAVCESIRKKLNLPGETVTGLEQQAAGLLGGNTGMHNLLGVSIKALSEGYKADSYLESLAYKQKKLAGIFAYITELQEKAQKLVEANPEAGEGNWRIKCLQNNEIFKTCKTWMGFDFQDLLNRINNREIDNNQCLKILQDLTEKGFVATLPMSLI